MNRNILTRRIPERALFPVITDVSKDSGGKFDSGDNDHFRAEVMKFQQKASGFGNCYGFGFIVFAEKHRRFGHIRSYNIRNGNQFFHPVLKAFGTGFIGFSIIAHYRIDNFQSIGIAFEKFEAGIHLFFASEESGINRLKIYSEIFIMFKGRFYIIRKIAENNFAEAAGMSGKYRSENRTDLVSHCGKNREYH